MTLTLFGTVAAGIGVVLLFAGAWQGERQNAQEHARFQALTEALTRQTEALTRQTGALTRQTEALENLTVEGFRRTDERLDALLEAVRPPSESGDGDADLPAGGREMPEEPADDGVPGTIP